MATTFSPTTLTITPGTLASGSARQSALYHTDTNQNYNDYHILVKVTPNGTPTGGKAVFVWVYTSEDDGTNFSGNATGSDAAITLDSPNQFNLGCAIPFQTSAVVRGGSFSLKAACGGSLPRAWGIIIENQLGVAFTSSSTTVSVEYNT